MIEIKGGMDDIGKGQIDTSGKKGVEPITVFGFISWYGNAYLVILHNFLIILKFIRQNTFIMKNVPSFSITCDLLNTTFYKVNRLSINVDILFMIKSFEGYAFNMM
ncbi:hypothetical protein [Flagellimonas sp.]|uniref:hypothetical protein n=1 Tax=Flagellimonas sp. TaxID=2058762 RepID=UPI003BA9A885